MRKIYILRENEEDGAVLDALEAQGLPADESEFSNPECPVCGAHTLLAYSEGDTFEVLTWFCLDEDEGANADAWYLVCSRFTCDYEEQVERVTEPAEATIFDLLQSHHSFDSYAGLISRRPDDMHKLIAYLEARLQEGPSRKLTCFLEEARWRYDDKIREVREWLQKVPASRQITFHLGDRKVRGAFLASTDEGFMVQTHPEGELLVVTAGSISFYGPHYFEPDGTDEPAPEEKTVDPSSFIMVESSEMVVIRGYHLALGDVDRLGLYHVRCWDASAANALQLENHGDNYWEGRFRRADIEARYDVTSMVKVDGFWLEVWGDNAKGWPAVRTEDSEVARALGLTPVRSWFENDRPEHERTIIHWSGVMSPDRIEERKEVRLYHWPIPDLQQPHPGE